MSANTRDDGNAATQPITRLAELALGDAKAAKRWLQRSNPALGHRVPLEIARSKKGCLLVENVLGRIAHGGVS